MSESYWATKFIKNTLYHFKVRCQEVIELQNLWKHPVPFQSALPGSYWATKLTKHPVPSKSAMPERTYATKFIKKPCTISKCFARNLLSYKIHKTPCTISKCFARKLLICKILINLAPFCMCAVGRVPQALVSHSVGKEGTIKNIYTFFSINSHNRAGYYMYHML
jgi:hypothetical protein